MAALVQQLQEVMWIGFAVAVVLGLLLSVWRSARVKAVRRAQQEMALRQPAETQGERPSA